MLTLLRRHFGYDSFRPLQEEIIAHILAGKNALVLMPTGGGKSLTFQLPALKFPGLTLVVSPLIALMKDQVDQLHASGIAAAFINSTLTTAEIAKVEQEAQTGKLKLLYLAPERITTADFQKLLRSLQVDLLAIDEAHCISEWGHDFRPDYHNLKILRQHFPNIPVIALTATATPRVQTDIREQLGILDARIFVSSFNRENLNYTVLPKKNFLGQILNLLGKHRNESVIIYCFSRADTEELAAALRENHFSALPYHAGLPAEIRSNTQEKFTRDEINIICATIAFGMGIDKPDIRLVIHSDLPKSIEGYYQETGRAGRDGLPAECVLFYSYGDRRKQDYFIRQIDDAQERECAEAKLAEVLNYGELINCRRKFLLRYFGENFESENCGGCDICLGSSEETDATELVQKILSAIIRTGERFGAAHIVALLTGEANARIRKYRHEKIPTFGAARESPAAAIYHAIKYLIARGLLMRSTDQYPTLAVSPLGKNFLTERKKITLPKFTATETARKEKNFILSETENELFEQLRALRKNLADERGVPPFVIFGDRSLLEMAHYLPQTVENFRKISGVGEHKLATFGEAFLSAIRDFASAHRLPELAIPATPSRNTSLRSKYSNHNRHSPVYSMTKKFIEQKLPLTEIAKIHGLKLDTIINHLEKLIAAGEKIDLTYLRPPEKIFAEINAAFLELGTEKLSPVHEKLEKRYSYSDLKLIRALLQQGQC